MELNSTRPLNLFEIPGNYFNIAIVSTLSTNCGPVVVAAAAYLIVWLLFVCIADENNGNGSDEEVDHTEVGVVHGEEHGGTGFLLIAARTRVGKVQCHAYHAAHVTCHDAVERALVMDALVQRLSVSNHDFNSDRKYCNYCHINTRMLSL